MYVTVLRQQCRAFIEKRKSAWLFSSLRFASVEDVAAFIKKSGISKVALSTEHVLTLLNTMRLDGEIEVGSSSY